MKRDKNLTFSKLSFTIIPGDVYSFAIILEEIVVRGEFIGLLFNEINFLMFLICIKVDHMKPPDNI